MMERQVGLVRGTWWPTRSSAGRMVQEEQDEVLGDLLVSLKTIFELGRSWWPSQDGDWCEGCASSVGFAGLATKPVVSLVDPQSQDRRLGDDETAPGRFDRWT
jgi:hypothetical protein